VDKFYHQYLIEKNMSKYNLFPSWRHSVPDKGLKTLEAIFKDSKKIGLNMDYNEGRAAFKYLSAKLEEKERKNGFFTIIDFENILRDTPRSIISKEQAGDIKMISRGFALKPKIAPKLEEEVGKEAEFNQAKKTEKPENTISDYELAAAENAKNELLEKRNAEAKLIREEEVREMAKEI